MSNDHNDNLHQSLGCQMPLTVRLQERRFEEPLKTLGLRADALLAAGIHLDVKYSDGLCVARGQKDGVIGSDL